MFQFKMIAAALAAAWLIQPAAAAEFGQGVAPATVELQAAAVAQPAPAADVKSVDAETQANAWLRKAGKRVGITSTEREDGSTEEQIISIGTARMPANAATISSVRTMGGMTATLDAKAQVVQILNTSASASVAMKTPETGLNTQFDQEVASMQEELAVLQEQLAAALADVDQEKANQVGSISMDVLLEKGVIASLEARGINLSAMDLKAESKARIQELESKARDLDGQVKALQKQIEAKKGELKEERTSSIDRLAQMVLTGAVVVNSFESYENGTYTVSVVVVWSPAQERFMRAIVGVPGAAQKLEFKPTTGKTLDEYIATMPWEMVSGGRWIIDRDGVPHIFGVASSEMLNNNPSTINRAKSLSNLNALHGLVMALKSDVMAHDGAKAKQQTLNNGKGGDESQTVESLAKEISAKVENMPLQGASAVLSEVRTSPFTGRKMYVTVMEYSPVSREAAQRTFAKQRDAAIDVNRAEQQTRGYIDGSLKQIRDAATDAQAYAEGQAQAAGEAVNRTYGSRGAAQQQPAQPAGRIENKSFGGAGDEDFKF